MMKFPAFSDYKMTNLYKKTWRTPFLYVFLYTRARSTNYNYFFWVADGGSHHSDVQWPPTDIGSNAINTQAGLDQIIDSLNSSLLKNWGSRHIKIHHQNLNGISRKLFCHSDSRFYQLTMAINDAKENENQFNDSTVYSYRIFRDTHETYRWYISKQFFSRALHVCGPRHQMFAHTDDIYIQVRFELIQEISYAAVYF
jgi:hypothetical protein